jgi:hypothetical protein
MERKKAIMELTDKGRLLGDVVREQDEQIEALKIENAHLHGKLDEIQGAVRYKRMFDDTAKRVWDILNDRN